MDPATQADRAPNFNVTRPGTSRFSSGNERSCSSHVNFPGRSARAPRSPGYGADRMDAGRPPSAAANPADFVTRPDFVMSRPVSSLAKTNMVRTTTWFAINVGTTVGAACLVGTLLPPIGGVAAAFAGIAALGFEIAALCSRSTRKQMGYSIAFSSLMGVGLTQLAQKVGMAVMGTAAVYTGALSGALVLTALACPSESLVSWRGPLVGALFGLLICSLATALMPASWGIVAALSLGQTIFGLGLFSAFTAYDVAMVAKDAERPDFNPVHRGLGIYLDVLNLFHYIVDLLAKNQAKKK